MLFGIHRQRPLPGAEGSGGGGGDEQRTCPMMSMHGLGSILLGLRTRRRSSGGRRIGFTMAKVLWGLLGGGYRIVAVGGRRIASSDGADREIRGQKDTRHHVAIRYGVAFGGQGGRGFQVQRQTKTRRQRVLPMVIGGELEM